VVDREDVWTLLEWPAGLLLFQATPLREVAGEIGRHFGRPVEVDSTVARRRVTAWFEDESLDEVVSAVCLVAGVKCEVRAARVRMTAP
jgi:ferric-dicitrate binding protein FerR (iron transport regulator)